MRRALSQPSFSTSSSSSASPVGTPGSRSRTASDASNVRPSSTHRPQASPGQEPGNPFSFWRFCLPRQDKGVDLTDVVTQGNDGDSSSQEIPLEPMASAQPNLSIRLLFDPCVHLTLDATGLNPNYHDIGNSPLSEEQIAQLLNHARQYCAEAPTGLPRGFVPARHVRQDGQPDIPAILNDDSLSQASKIDIYRAAKAYVPGTCTDPVYARVSCVMGSAPVAFLLLVTGMLLVAIYTNRNGQDSAPGQSHLTNDTQAGALMQAAKEEISKRCASAGQALDPLFFTLMLIGALAFAT